MCQSNCLVVLLRHNQLLRLDSGNKATFARRIKYLLFEGVRNTNQRRSRWNETFLRKNYPSMTKAESLMLGCSVNIYSAETH
jgi:hypothetical protein